MGFALAISVSACVEGTPAEPAPASTLSPVAAFYLDAAVDIMETNSIRKYEIDWAEFRATTFAEAEAVSAQTTADTYPMIIAALERIGDNHSFFQPPSSPQLGSSMSAPAPTAPATVDPRSELLEPGVGYIEVPAFSGGDEAADSLALAYHQMIEGIDTTDTVCRWVVDLRGNTGGNMWPMIAGLGPILGADTLGMFVDPDSLILRWFYDEEGSAGLEDAPITMVDTPYAVAGGLPNVAILQDSVTASSGEAVAVAFRGRPFSRSFGSETWGVSTANAGFLLSDNAVIFLTVSTMADRNGVLYGERIVPDELVFGMKTGERATDAALDAAVTWLNSQACG